MTTRLNPTSTFLFPPVAQPAAAQDALWRRAGRAVWSTLEAVGEARAQRELLRLAASYQRTNPRLARQLRQAALSC